MFEPVLERLAPFSREFLRRGKLIYLVGGAVRNLLLGKPAQDFDFATDALPSEVQGFFRKVLPTGLQHGTVTVLFQGAAYEVTTFRIDGTYADGRRPDGITFTSNLEEDLKRRDFTINAIALDLQDGSLVDPHDGQGDIRRRLLRAIGNPGQRFDEDALRLLRLFRFASQLGFSIDPPTMASVAPRRSKLVAVSRERVREELTKAMAGDRPDLAWKPLQDLGFLQDLFPLLPVQPLETPSMNWVRLPPLLRWSVWLTLACGSDQDAWDRSLKALTFSNADREAILGPPKALAYLTRSDTVSSSAKALVNAWGSRDRIPLGVSYLQTLEEAGFWEDDRGWKRELLRVGESKEPVFLKDLAVGGADLMAAGIASGPEVGKALRDLQKLVWSEPSLNSCEGLLEKARSLR